MCDEASPAGTERVFFPWIRSEAEGSATDPAPSPAPQRPAPAPQHVTDKALDDLFRWPPDVFATTARALRATGVYRHAVSPERLAYGAEVLAACSTVRAEWFRAIRSQGPLPQRITELKAQLFAGAGTFDMTEIARQGDPDRIAALLRLHAYADAVCDGFGFPNSNKRGCPDIYLSANILLEVTGSLSRLPTTECVVLPKMRTPQRGMTLRSMSHFLTYHETEVAVRWRTLPWISRRETGSSVNLLAIPWPFEVFSTDFRSTQYGKAAEHPEYGYFAYEPGERLPLQAVRDLYGQARKEASRIDVVVFPEVALSSRELCDVQALLVSADPHNVPLIIAGLRDADDGAGGTRAVNRVSLSAYFAERWYTILQDKHHRWMLEESQIRQYALSGLNPAKRWWEAIDLPERTLTLLAPSDWLAICPLICEDLAQLEPVSELIRGVGPTLVIAILMDGPQLDTRWAARYVGVLADDPGSSVLTLTSLGMARRSRARNSPERRVVAQWKDASGGESIELGNGSSAFLLTVTGRRGTEYTADGRDDGGSSASFVFHGSRALADRRQTARMDNGAAPAASPPAEGADPRAGERGGGPAAGSLPPGTEADVEELAIFCYIVDALLDAPGDGRESLWKLVMVPGRAMEPSAHEPFATIWRVIGTALTRPTRRRGHAVPPVVGEDGQLNEGFNAALLGLRAFLDAVGGSASGGAALDVDRWTTMVAKAAANLEEIGRPAAPAHAGFEGSPTRIARLVNLSILWALHNRVEQLRAATTAEGRDPDGVQRLRKLSERIEKLLDEHRL